MISSASVSALYSAETVFLITNPDVPSIRNADKLSARELDAEIRRLTRLLLDLAYSGAAPQEAGTPYGLYVYDGVLPDDAPDGPSLYLDPPSDGPFGTVDGRIDGPVIDRLGPLDRALMLLYLDERSHREIAEVLGIGESNVATRLHRLRLRIAAQFADAPGGTDTPTPTRRTR